MIPMSHADVAAVLRSFSARFDQLAREMRALADEPALAGTRHGYITELDVTAALAGAMRDLARDVARQS